MNIYTQDCPDEIIEQTNGYKYIRLDKFEGLKKENKNLESKLAIALEALERANNRHLDYDMMQSKHSLEFLQEWRGECIDALTKIRGEL